MDLIDRYVVEVARHLPAKSAEDVAEELRSLLSDAFEARAARTGRPKDEALAVEVLRETRTRMKNGSTVGWGEPSSNETFFVRDGSLRALGVGA